MKPTIIIVGADKGGVGKTTITRVLLDYLKDRGAKPSVFDTEGVLHKFYSYAKIVDIDKVAGQMQIFDGIEKAGITVVDLAARKLSQTLRAMRDAGKLDKADQGKERLIVMHVLGSDTESMGEIIDTNALLDKAAEHVLIENHSGTGHFFKWDMEARKKFFESIEVKAELTVPHLDDMATEAVGLRRQSFASFIGNEDKKNSPWLVRLVASWRKKVYAEFDKLALLPKAD